MPKNGNNDSNTLHAWFPKHLFISSHALSRAYEHSLANGIGPVKQSF